MAELVRRWVNKLPRSRSRKTGKWQHASGHASGLSSWRLCKCASECVLFALPPRKQLACRETKNKMRKESLSLLFAGNTQWVDIINSIIVCQTAVLDTVETSSPLSSSCRSRHLYLLPQLTRPMQSVVYHLQKFSWGFQQSAYNTCNRSSEVKHSK